MIEPANAQSIAHAAALLRRGELVAFPTETVYGLGADATSDEAVARVFAAKARPSFNPLIVHVFDLAGAHEIAAVGAVAETIIAHFWPGPLTLVLPRREPQVQLPMPHLQLTALQHRKPVSLLATAGLDTIAVRSPVHRVARSLLAEFGGPLVAPSANRSGHVSATDAAHVAADFGEQLFILDGGPSTLGIESTVLDLTGEDPVILRPGALTREALERLLGPLEVAAAGAIKSPGMLASHYAPNLPLRLNATSVREGEALLAFGPSPPRGAARMLNLSPTGDLVEAAAHLFAYLRALDHRPALPHLPHLPKLPHVPLPHLPLPHLHLPHIPGLDHPAPTAIAVMPIPEHGLGEAINDRLRRAAAPRS